MSGTSMPVPNVPLSAARRIHETCKQFEFAWRGPTRPQLDAFLAGVVEPERQWLLTELIALEVELRRGAGEQPTEAEYRRSFPSDEERSVIAAAFRRCADSEDESPARANVPSGAAAAPNIDGYEIIEMLGRGGMGVVYKARDIRLKRIVALKTVLSSEHAGEELLARFRTEAETVARLQHPNIVQIFDVGVQDGRPYLTFEYIEGHTLAEFGGREPQPARAAAEVLEATAHAIHYAHQHGVVHRDLKPANILLAAGGLSSLSGSSIGSNISRRSLSGLSLAMSGQHATSTGLVPKITDFGLAKDLTADLELTSTGAILGTPYFMSPEQADGRRDIGPASDIYSLGVILYVLLTGRPPFQGPMAIETLKMVVGSEPVAPTQLLPGLPKDLETICLKCLDKDPARRYETAGALAEDLRRFLNDEPILARASGRLEKSWRWCRRNPSIAVSLASIMLVLAAEVVVSSYFAYMAGEEAKLARQAEDEARQRATAETVARQDADTQWNRAQLSIVEALLDEGLVHCENQDVTRGLLTMVRALELAPPGALEMKDVIRLNLAFWQGQLSVLKTHGGYQSSMTAAAFAPDGKTFLSGDWGNHQNILGPPYLVLHDLQTGQASDKITEHALAIWRVAYSPDGTRFASASFDGTARLWDAATLAPVGPPMPHRGRVYSLAFSPEGQWLLTGSNDPAEFISELRVWNAESGVAEGEPVTQPGKLRAVAWSGDGKLWASGSAEIDPNTNQTRGGEIRFWDADTHQAHGQPLRLSDPVLAVAFQPELGLLACGTKDGLVRFWDPATAGSARLTLAIKPEKDAAGNDVPGTGFFSATGDFSFALGSPQTVTVSTNLPDNFTDLAAGNDATGQALKARTRFALLLPN